MTKAKTLSAGMAAAALVGAIGFAYAQSSLDTPPANTDMNAQQQQEPLQQQPAQQPSTQDTLPQTAEPSPAATPAPSPATTPSTDSYGSGSASTPEPMTERAPQADRN